MTKFSWVTVVLVLSVFALGVVIGRATMGGESMASGTSTSESLVTGIGGVFFKVNDPEVSREWYREHLGMEGDGPGINYF